MHDHGPVGEARINRSQLACRIAADGDNPVREAEARDMDPATLMPDLGAVCPDHIRNTKHSLCHPRERAEANMSHND